MRLLSSLNSLNTIYDAYYEDIISSIKQSSPTGVPRITVEFYSDPLSTVLITIDASYI